MIAALAPHPHQIRHYALDALNSFDTLESSAAIANAKDNLHALLAYLDRLADYSVPILDSIGVEPWIRLEGPTCDPQLDDLADFKRARPGF